MKNGVKIAIGVGLVLGVSILVMRHSIRKKGYSKNKFLANTFDVPYLEKKFDAEKYQDVEEQA